MLKLKLMHGGKSILVRVSVRFQSLGADSVSFDEQEVNIFYALNMCN